MRREALGPVGIWISSTLHEAWREELAEAAPELEELGYGAMWLGRVDGMLETPSLLLASTRRMVVATAIVSVWTNPADMVASSYRRVDAEHPDRLVVGLGSSHAAEVGEESYRPLERLCRYLDDLDAGAPSLPRDGRLLAALGPRALMLAAQRSLGAHPYMVTPDHTRYAREVMGPAALLAPEQKVILEADPAAARALARGSLANRRTFSRPNYTNNFLRMGFTPTDLEGGGSDRFVDAHFAWGDLDAIVRRVEEHHAAGADHVGLQVLTSTDESRARLPRGEWRRLAEALGTGAGQQR